MKCNSHKKEENI